MPGSQKTQTSWEIKVSNSNKYSLIISSAKRKLEKNHLIHFIKHILKRNVTQRARRWKFYQENKKKNETGTAQPEKV